MARTASLLGMLRRIGADARSVTACGRDAFLADTDDGRLRRLAGTMLLIQTATVAERLDAGFQAEHPDVPWTQIRGSRHLVADADDQLDDEVVHDSLVAGIPDLLNRLGLPVDDSTTPPTAEAGRPPSAGAA